MRLLLCLQMSKMWRRGQKIREKKKKEINKKWWKSLIMTIKHFRNASGYKIEIRRGEIIDTIDDVHGYLVPAIVKGVNRTYGVDYIMVITDGISYDIDLGYTSVESEFNVLTSKDDERLIFDY